MRRKTLADRTTQKNQKTFLAAPIAASYACLTVFAPLAANTKARHLSPPLNIGIDIMGNDHVPQDLLSALHALALPSNVHLTIIGTPPLASLATPFSFVAAPEVIGMDEHPLLALRKKKQASMCVALRSLKEGRFDAVVSAGNTGALVSSAKMILSTFKGILRPALLTLMPTKKEPVAVLDVGANVSVKAANLVQFATMGAAFQRVRGLQLPRVGFLNIGSEASKGTTDLRLAYQTLQEQSFPFCFVGNIEGRTVFDGQVDVLVTDGFTGNVFLKTAEGIASLILDRVEQHTPQKELKNFQSLHYSEYPGALLIGVKGLVIKCHGYSSATGFANAIMGAINLAQNRVVQKLTNELS